MTTVSEQDASLIESELGRESWAAAGTAAAVAQVAANSAMQVESPVVADTPAAVDEVAIAAAQAANANAELQEALALAGAQAQDESRGGRISAATRPDPQNLSVIKVHSELRTKLEKQREKEHADQANETLQDRTKTEAVVAEDGGQDDDHGGFGTVVTHVSSHAEGVAPDVADNKDAEESLAQSGARGSAAYGSAAYATVMTQSRVSANEQGGVGFPDVAGSEEISLGPSTGGTEFARADFEGHWCKVGVAGGHDLTLQVKDGLWGVHGTELKLEFVSGATKGSWETNGWRLLTEKSSPETLTWKSGKGEERNWRRLSAKEVESLPHVPPLQLDKGSDKGEGGSRMRWCLCVPNGDGADN